MPKRPGSLQFTRSRRKNLIRSKQTFAQLTARSRPIFNYPHSFKGQNTAYNYIPQKDNYNQLQRKFKPGDKPVLAYPNTKEFPSWWKPYGTSYRREGWFVAVFGLILIYGYSYTNDIKQQKGRTSIKDFYNTTPLITTSKKSRRQIFKNRVKAGDEEYTKFLVEQHRAHH